ncbi:MAG: hypothetical protein DHS20C20_13760 [Ardenticatenaceae bacterium]|nr:MAG: hypothetical protein DHS20C20_13760 [Ardenticatenaceae bacterium]
MRVYIMQRISAVALIFFMTVHMVVVHYPPGHIDFSRIIERMANPVWKAIDIAFLFFVLMHALTGVYVVLTDSDEIARYKKALAGAAAVLGVVAFIYGTMTVIAFQPPV